MNTKTIKLDISKKLYETIVAKQGDTKSRFLLFNLFDNSLPFDLTGKTVRVYGEKNDGNTIFNDLVITDYKKGYCILELTNQMLAIPGLVSLELVIYEGDKKLSLIPFTLNVVKSINNDEAIVSTNEFTALANALKTVSNVENKADKQQVEELSAQLETKANKNSVFSMANMGQDVKEAMTGGSVAVVGRDTVLTENIVDNQVTIKKTNFISEKIISYNLFNKNTCIDGFYLDYGSGEKRENSAFSYSDFIDCEPGNYVMNQGEFQICYYDKSEIFKSGFLTTNGKFSIPDGISKFRVSIITSMKDTVQINKGESLLSYDDYASVFDFEKPLSKKYSKFSDVIIVSINGKGDFKTITEAVESAKDGDVIIINSGTYQGEVIRAWTKTLYLIGVDKSNTIIINNTGDYKNPPLEICSGLLKNLTIIADKNLNGFEGIPCYAIHIENNFMEGKTLEIDNCHIVSHVNFAIGCGLRKDCLLDIHDSRLESYSELQGGLYVHDTDVDDMVGLQRLRVKNTEILSNSSNNSAQQLVLQSMHKDNSDFNCEFVNVNVRNMITGNQNYAFQDASDWKSYDRPEQVPNISLSKASYGNSLNKLDYV